MHKVTMMVKIPDEEWEAFKESVKEAGQVRFKFRNSTIFAEIVTATFKYKDYIFWNKADVPLDDKGFTITYYVARFLKEKFPGYRFIGQYFEFNRIDLYIVEEKLPIEIQATLRQSNDTPGVAQFEKYCRQQIEENIRTLGKCWFFFDEGFLRYLQTDVTQGCNIQFDWLYKSMNEGSLTVFTIDYKGNIKERNLEDFDFISKISTTYVLGKDNDRRILEQNKYDILIKVLDHYRITQEELDNIGLAYYNNHVNNQQFINYAKKLDSNRYVQIGYVFESMKYIVDINRAFSGDIIDNKCMSYSVHIGIFESENLTRGGAYNKNRIRFIDHPGVAQFFPEYIKHKDRWDAFKGKWLTRKQLEGIIKGDIDYNWYKKIDNTDDEYHNNKEDNDKEINTEIKNECQIITKDIKNSGQTNIEDAWKH